jgi:hypothetical protein
MLEQCWETEGLELKRPCLNSVLDLDPENEPASLALLLFDQRRPETEDPSLPIANLPGPRYTPARLCCRSARADGV